MVAVEAAQRGGELLDGGAGVVHPQRGAPRIGPHLWQPQPPLRRRRLLHLRNTQHAGSTVTRNSPHTCGGDHRSQRPAAQALSCCSHILLGVITAVTNLQRPARALRQNAVAHDAQKASVAPPKTDEQIGVTSVKISRASGSLPCSARTAPMPLTAYTLPA